MIASHPRTDFDDRFKPMYIGERLTTYLKLDPSGRFTTRETKPGYGRGYQEGRYSRYKQPPSQRKQPKRTPWYQLSIDHLIETIKLYDPNQPEDEDSFSLRVVRANGKKSKPIRPLKQYSPPLEHRLAA